MATNTQRKIYISKRCGRLANRLVIFANIIAYAEEHGLRLRNYTFHTYCKAFEATAQNFHCQYPQSEKKAWQTRLSGIGNLLIELRLYYRIIDILRRFPKQHHGITLEETPNMQLLDTPEMEQKLHAQHTIFVHNWKCRCPALVKKHAQAIRNYFKPVAHHRNAAESVYHPLKKKSDLVIGIHMRQGDYKEWLNGRFYFTSEEYAEIMQSVSGLFPGQKISFIICSDEAQDKKTFPDLTVAFGPGTPVSDLYTLSLCDYLIGPVSTFSQWASFYGQTPLVHLRKDKKSIQLSDFKVSELHLLEH